MIFGQLGHVGGKGLKSPVKEPFFLY